MGKDKKSKRAKARRKERRELGEEERVQGEERERSPRRGRKRGGKEERRANGSRFLEAHCSIEQRYVFGMLRVTVALTSGRHQSLSIPEVSKVGDLKALAQRLFERYFLRLVRADGRILIDFTETLQAAGLQDGEAITVVAGQAQLAATGCAFALWYCGSNGVVTWGKPACGGDSSRVQNQLKKVQQVWASARAFAAILEDGSIVTWGDPACGGDSSEVQEQLRSVQQVQATHQAFAAILEDGSVVTWGSPGNGGDSSAVQDQLRNVQQIHAAATAFAGIREDGSVITWGNPRYGGDSSAVQDHLKNVKQVQILDSLRSWKMTLL